MDVDGAHCIFWGRFVIPTVGIWIRNFPRRGITGVDRLKFANQQVAFGLRQPLAQLIRHKPFPVNTANTHINVNPSCNPS